MAKRTKAGDIRFPGLGAIPKPMADIFVAGSSGINFIASYLAATYLPAHIGAEVSYAIYFAQLWAGIFGVVFYNIVRIEEPASGGEFRVRWYWLALPAALSLLWLDITLVILLALRFAIVRGTAVPPGGRTSLAAGMALIVLGAAAAVAAVVFDVYRFYALLAAVLSLSLAFMTWRHAVWVVLPGRLMTKILNQQGFIARVLLRSSLDIYIFSVSVVLLYVVMHTTTPAVSADFVKIYSAMAIASLFVAVIESRVLNTNAEGSTEIGWPSCVGMAAVSMALVFVWAVLVIHASSLAGACAAFGAAFAVLSGNLLARIRRRASPRSMMLLSIAGVIAMLTAFSPLVFLGRVGLEGALIAMLANMVLQFGMLLLLDRLSRNQGPPRGSGPEEVSSPKASAADLTPPVGASLLRLAGGG